MTIQFEESDAFLPLRDVVVKTLRQQILTGKLKPGERLLEIHLAEELGVSRTPIREAIRKLELEGLVTMIPRRGAEVAQISEKGMSDVLEVRKALDSLAGELACARITEGEKEQLREACLDFEKAIATKDKAKIAKADVAFHNIITEATRNIRLAQLLNNLSEQMYRYRFEYIKDENQHKALAEEHKRIYEAIRDNKPEQAVGALKNHIDNQEKTIVRQIMLNRAKNME